MNTPTYITADEAAEILRTSVDTLAGWRVREIGPRYIKLPGRVLYTVAAIEEYMEAHEHVTSVEPASAEQSPAPPEDEAWLSPDEASATLRASPATLSRWRVQGCGPKYIKRRGRIFYTPAAIRAFADDLTRSKTRGG